MLKYQLRNIEKWKEELQEGLKKAYIGPQTHALIIHVIKCFATDTYYKISRDYDGLNQAVCFDPYDWKKNFLEHKLLPGWMEIINKELEQLGLPSNI